MVDGLKTADEFAGNPAMNATMVSDYAGGSPY